MRLLSLDYTPVYGEGNTYATFSSDISAFDHDVVIWDPARSFKKYTEWAQDFQGLPSLHDAFSAQIKADTARRRSEFTDFLAAGRTLVVLACGPLKCWVRTGETQYSGTGRNARVTNIVDRFDLLSALPGAPTTFVPGVGDRIEILGDGPVQSLLAKYRRFIEYNAYVDTADDAAVRLAKIAGTEKTVSLLWRTSGGGAYVLLPTNFFFNPEQDHDEEDADDNSRPLESTVDADDELADGSAFQADLLEAIINFTGNEGLERPPWTSRFSTRHQRYLRDVLARHQAAIEEARAQHAVAQAAVEVAEQRDQLYLGTGRQLELRVRDVLELLGASVTEPEPGRTDWKATFPERVAVVEVKGVKKSAAEKNAAQLEKWVSIEFERTGVQPKGILVVNAWRDTPLDERKKDFPDQMLTYSTSRAHCLVSGLDLFVIAADVESDPNRAQYWRDKILTTEGHLADVPDWRTVIDISGLGETDSTHSSSVADDNS